MDRKYIDENQIAIKYLRNKLEENELEQYEVYLMENPDEISDLEVDGLFLEHSSKVKTSAFEKRWSWVHWPLLTGLLACSLLLVVTLTFIPLKTDERILELYTVRSSESAYPSFKVPFLDRVWPFSPSVTIKVSADSNVLFEHAFLYRNIGHLEFELLASHERPETSDLGEVEFNIIDQPLTKGLYKFVLIQEVERGSLVGDADIRNWVYFFEIK